MTSFIPDQRWRKMASHAAESSADVTRATTPAGHTLRLAWLLVADLKAEPDALVHLDGQIFLGALEKVASELGLPLAAPLAIARIQEHLAQKHGAAAPDPLWLTWMSITGAQRVESLIRELSRRVHFRAFTTPAGDGESANVIEAVAAKPARSAHLERDTATRSKAAPRREASSHATKAVEKATKQATNDVAGSKSASRPRKLPQTKR